MRITKTPPAPGGRRLDRAADPRDRRPWTITNRRIVQSWRGPVLVETKGQRRSLERGSDRWAEDSEAGGRKGESAY